MVSLEELTKDLDAAKTAWDNFTQNIGNFSLDGVTKKFKSFTSQMTKSLGDLNASFQNTDKMAASFGKVASGLGQILTISTNFDAFKNLTVQGGNSASTMSDQFELLVQRFGSFEKAADKLASTVSKPFANALRSGEAATKAYLAHASSAEHLESAYLSLQGATGQLSKEFEDMAGLDNRLAKFNTLLQDAAGQSNKTLKEVSQYAMALGTIPGALDQIVDTGKGFDDQLTGLTAALQLAAGSGRGVEEVTKAMDIAYEKLGNSQGQVSDNAQKGAQLFALMSEASQKLNLRFNDTQGYLSHVADAFKNIGDNTQGATNILTRFTGALQGTGLTAKASVEVVQNMVDSMKNLEMGTKALISARSGGPGGLQGAFQVENLLRQGKVDEVAKMMERTLRQQFRGRIYTQEEAGQSAQAASQFMRQRTMLTSGAFGGLAKDNETASRLLEALKSGSNSAGPTINALMAVKETTGHGNEIQERQTTALNMLNGGMDRLVSINEERFKIDARKAIGTGDENAFSESLKNYRNLVTQQGTDEARRKEPLGFEESLKRQNMQGIGNFVDGFGVVKSVGKKVSSEIGAATSAAVDIMSDTSEYMAAQKEKKDIDNETARTRRGVLRGNQTMRAATTEVMQQVPATLAAQLPKSANITRHEVEVKPLEVNIQVTRDRDTEVTTTTNYPNTTVRNVVNQSIKGYENTNRFNR